MLTSWEYNGKANVYSPFLKYSLAFFFNSSCDLNVVCPEIGTEKIKKEKKIIIYTNTLFK